MNRHYITHNDTLFMSKFQLFDHYITSERITFQFAVPYYVSRNKMVGNKYVCL
jgi:hypothetical protein